MVSRRAARGRARQRRLTVGHRRAKADGSGFRVIGSHPAYAVDWSPGGSRLVFAVALLDTFVGTPSQEELPTEEWSSIYVIDADGSDERWLAVGEYPDWSP